MAPLSYMSTSVDTGGVAATLKSAVTFPTGPKFSSKCGGTASAFFVVDERWVFSSTIGFQRAGAGGSSGKRKAENWYFRHL